MTIAMPARGNDRIAIENEEVHIFVYLPITLTASRDS
jgi:hypothetical protein